MHELITGLLSPVSMKYSSKCLVVFCFVVRILQLNNIYTIQFSNLLFYKCIFSVRIADLAARATDSSSSWAPLEFNVIEMAAHGLLIAIFGHHAVRALVFPMMHVRGVVHSAVTERSRRTSAAGRSPNLVGQVMQRPESVVDGPWCQMGYHFCEKSEDAVLPGPSCRGREPIDRTRQCAPQTQCIHIQSHRPCQLLAGIV